MKNEIYHGVEAEGRLRGVPTVFCKFPDVRAIKICKRLGYSHIFFGARGYILREPEYRDLLYLNSKEIPSEWIITIQVPLSRADSIPAWVFTRCHVLLYAELPSASMLANDVEIKLENRLRAAVYTNPQMLDLTYVRDVEEV